MSRSRALLSAVLYGVAAAEDSVSYSPCVPARRADESHLGAHGLQVAHEHVQMYAVRAPVQLQRITEQIIQLAVARQLQYAMSRVSECVVSWLSRAGNDPMAAAAAGTKSAQLVGSAREICATQTRKRFIRSPKHHAVTHTSAQSSCRSYALSTVSDASLFILVPGVLKRFYPGAPKNVCRSEMKLLVDCMMCSLLACVMLKAPG